MPKIKDIDNLRNELNDVCDAEAATIICTIIKMSSIRASQLSIIKDQGLLVINDISNLQLKTLKGCLALFKAITTSHREFDLLASDNSTITIDLISNAPLNQDNAAEVLGEIFSYLRKKPKF